jgi:hypothetical protein
MVRIRPGNWKTRYSFVPLNGNEAKSEALDRLSNTLPYVPNPGARGWEIKKRAELMERRRESLQKWDGKPAAERPVLHTPVWQSASHLSAPASGKAGAVTATPSPGVEPQ